MSALEERGFVLFFKKNGGRGILQQKGINATQNMASFGCVNIAYVGQRMLKLQDMDKQNTAASLLIFCSQ